MQNRAYNQPRGAAWMYLLILLTFPIFFATNDLFRNHRELLAWLPEWRPTYFLAIVLPFGTILPALALGWLIRSHDGDRRRFGATLTPRDLSLGLLGLALGGMMLYFQAWRPLPPEARSLGVLIHDFIWLVFPSIAEALVFIGVVFHVTEIGVRRWWHGRAGRVAGAIAAIVISALAFGLFHFSYPAPWNTWDLVRTMFFVWLGVAAFYALTRSMPATLMLHTTLAMTGFLRNQLELPGSDMLGLALDAVAILTVLVFVANASAAPRALPGHQPAGLR